MGNGFPFAGIICHPLPPAGQGETVYVGTLSGKDSKCSQPQNSRRSVQETQGVFNLSRGHQRRDAIAECHGTCCSHYSSAKVNRLVSDCDSAPRRTKIAAGAYGANETRTRQNHFRAGGRATRGRARAISPQDVRCRSRASPRGGQLVRAPLCRIDRRRPRRVPVGRFPRRDWPS